MRDALSPFDIPEIPSTEEILASYSNPEYMNDYEANEVDHDHPMVYYRADGTPFVSGTIGAGIGVVEEPALRDEISSADYDEEATKHLLDVHDE